jgi:GNAT superfamily N-acetyltransferase
MHFRAATSGDIELLWFLMVEAFNWDGTARFTRDEIMADAHTARYLGGWKRARDFGVIAMEHHQPIGGLWARALPASTPGYGYVADDVPEIGMAVMPERRGAGVGSALLAESIVRARTLGWRGLSLSVEDGNGAARRLYEHHGFAVVARNGDSDTMFLGL